MRAHSNPLNTAWDIVDLLIEKERKANEIAKILGVTHAAVRRHLKQGLARELVTRTPPTRTHRIRLAVGGPGMKAKSSALAVSIIESNIPHAPNMTMSVGDIEAKLGLGYTTAYAACRRLVERGVLSTRLVRNKGARNDQSVYTFIPEAERAEPVGAAEQTILRCGSVDPPSARARVAGDGIDTGAARMNRDADIELLAPVAPPCFDSRSQWVVYLIAADNAYRIGHTPGPLLQGRGQPAAFNPKFSFCEDCSPRHEGAMKHVGRCEPQHLIQLFAAKAATP